MCIIFEDEKQINWQTHLLGGDDEATVQHPASNLIKCTAVKTCLFLSPGNYWCCSTAQFQDCSRVVYSYNSLFAVSCRWPTEEPKLDERFLHPWCISEVNYRSQTLAWEKNYWARYDFCQEKYIAEFLRWVLLLPGTKDEFGQRHKGTRNWHFNKKALQLELSWGMVGLGGRL